MPHLTVSIPFMVWAIVGAHKSMFELRLGLRTKVILISSFLLILPWLGYKYVWEMEKLLRQGQEQTLIGTTRAVATALNERPKLFNRQASFLRSVEKGRDLYAYELHNPIKLDGKISDWAEYDDKMMSYGRDHVQFSRRRYTANSISFKHMVGKYQGYLYAVFEVKDKHPVMRRSNSIRVDRNDHLVIAMTTSDGDFQRYAISPYEDGWVNAFQISEIPCNEIHSRRTPVYIERFEIDSANLYSLLRA